MTTRQLNLSRTPLAPIATTVSATAGASMDSGLSWNRYAPRKGALAVPSLAPPCTASAVTASPTAARAHHQARSSHARRGPPMSFGEPEPPTESGTSSAAGKLAASDGRRAPASERGLAASRSGPAASVVMGHHAIGYATYPRVSVGFLLTSSA